ncbi:MAG: hypothetical protein IT285_03545 [Bdellovibrionales bacterium]|nr:hypothetical protein [Bdellovibrionales bacterium]
MDTRRRIFGSLLIVCLGAGCAGEPAPSGVPHRALFTSDPPADPAYREELTYLQRVAGFPEADARRIRDRVALAATALSMPQALLWCVLFQESRLDRLKNARNARNAKGIGQFTAVALDELNRDTALYDARTPAFLREQVGDESTIQFILPTEPRAPVPRASYYRLETGVASTAAYLNNRYHHLARTLGRRDLAHDPQVLWLLAAMAYNKGPRSVNVFLHRLGRLKGDDRVRAVLHDPSELVAVLSDAKLMHRIYFYFWEKPIRDPYVEEMGANMRAIARCALEPEGGP